MTDVLITGDLNLLNKLKCKNVTLNVPDKDYIIDIPDINSSSGSIVMNDVETLTINSSNIEPGHILAINRNGAATFDDFPKRMTPTSPTYEGIVISSGATTNLNGSFAHHGYGNNQSQTFKLQTGVAGQITFISNNGSGTIQIRTQTNVLISSLVSGDRFQTFLCTSANNWRRIN